MLTNYLMMKEYDLVKLIDIRCFEVLRKLILISVCIVRLIDQTTQPPTNGRREGDHIYYLGPTII